MDLWTIADDGTIESRSRGLVGHLRGASRNDQALIAAAPELLAALKSMLIHCYDVELDDDIRDAVAAAQEAYRRATRPA